MRLKEHEQVVLVLEKSPRASTLGSIKYVIVFNIYDCSAGVSRKNHPHIHC